MIEILTAISLAIALEGLLYAVFPEAMKKFMVRIIDQPTKTLRRAGMVAMLLHYFSFKVVAGKQISG